MFDIVIIVITLMFLVIQVIVSGQLSLLVAKSKKNGGRVVSDFLFDGLPYFLLIFTAVFLVCAIKTGDTLILMLPIVLSICFLFDMHIICIDGDKITVHYFLLQKKVCTSLSNQGTFLVAEFGEKKKVIRLSKKKQARLL